MCFCYVLFCPGCGKEDDRLDPIYGQQCPLAKTERVPPSACTKLLRSEEKKLAPKPCETCEIIDLAAEQFIRDVKKAEEDARNAA
jgi:hypothetical protein